MKPRRYYQFVERDSSEVSLKWKLSHAFVFILTAIVSLVSAYAFADIFDTFNYRCILYSQVDLKLIDIRHPYDHLNLSTTDTTMASTVSTATDKAVSTATDKAVSTATGKVAALKIFDLDDPLSVRIIGAVLDGQSRRRGIGNWADAKPVPNRTGIFIFEDQLWLRDKDRWKVVHMSMTSCVFSTVMTCDLALFVPLFSTVVASILAAVTLVCGKGGRGYTSDTIKSSWIYVYPIIVGSAAMAIMSFISMNMVVNGLQQFCEDFQKYTGKYKCSSLMDYFTVQQLLGRRYFYRDFLICQYSYTVTTILWCGQLGLACARIACVVDFRLDQVLIRRRKRFENRRDEDDNVEEVWDKIKTPKLLALYEQLKKSRNR